MRVVFCLRHRAPERRLYRGRTGKLPVSRWAYPLLVGHKKPEGMVGQIENMKYVNFLSGVGCSKKL